MDVMYQETVVLFLSASFFFFFWMGMEKCIIECRFFWGGGYVMNILSEQEHVFWIMLMYLCLVVSTWMQWLAVFVQF